MRELTLNEIEYVSGGPVDVPGVVIGAIVGAILGALTPEAGPGPVGVIVGAVFGAIILGGG